jgi:tRNA pseudouridine38-40 synthase
VSARVGPGDRRIRLRLHYDGSGFAGWQVQPERAGRTVQGELEAALARITQAPGRVIAAGRTDSGVHATGQVVSATVPLKWEPEPLRRALNGVLPFDIWVAEAAAAEERFHARYDAVARGYVYRLGSAPVSRSPFLRGRCWALGEPLSPGLLHEAARRLPGEHSFRAFAKSGQPQRGDVCTVHRAEWREWHGVGMTFHVVANRFLHHMVRYLVGTMTDVARQRRAVTDMDALLAGDAGVVTSPPAPPEGLYLSRVYYPGDDWSVEDTDEILS